MVPFAKLQLVYIAGCLPNAYSEVCVVWSKLVSHFRVKPWSIAKNIDQNEHSRTWESDKIMPYFEIHRYTVRQRCRKKYYISKPLGVLPQWFCHQLPIYSTFHFSCVSFCQWFHLLSMVRTSSLSSLPRLKLWKHRLKMPRRSKATIIRSKNRRIIWCAVHGA